ncbi:MAG: hypothetical protein JWR69_592, partial [Pedosphaera sp.]|nr:hypothetical protein [Pedosphaera sp.]
LAEMCQLILRDEAGHVAFHRERIADANRSMHGFRGTFWRTQFWLLGHAAATMLWLNRGPCLTAIGGSRSEYFRDVRRQLGRFLVSLRRPDESLKERFYPAPRTTAARVPVATVMSGINAS